MRQQLRHGDTMLAAGAKFRDILRHRGIQRQQALLRQLMHQHRGDRLGGREQTDRGIRTADNRPTISGITRGIATRVANRPLHDALALTPDP